MASLVSKLDLSFEVTFIYSTVFHEGGVWSEIVHCILFVFTWGSLVDKEYERENRLSMLSWWWSWTSLEGQAES